MDLTPNEEKLIEYAKKSLVKYNEQRLAKGGLNTLYSFVLSESGQIYDGASFEPNIAQATTCGERHAIANLVMNEAYNSKIESIVVSDPVPSVQDKSTPPCGTCRHLIWQFGKPNTTVIMMQYIHNKNGWTFPKIEKLTIAELYPHPYEPNPNLWD